MLCRFLHCLFALFFFSTLCISINAQKSKLKILINSDRFQANDTLDFTAIYLLGEKKLPPATLALVMKENNGNGIWQMRWPMLNGHASAKLVFPANIPKGNYTLYFAVQPRFFQIYGKILYPPGFKNLTGVIYSPTIRSREFDLPVENGIFKIDKLLFQNTAILHLNVPISKKIMPAVSVEAWLDSAFQPAAAISKEIIIGMGENSILENKKVENWMAYFDPYYQTNILGNLSAAQKFDSLYVSAKYKNTMLSFDCLDDSTLVKSASLEAFLSNSLPNFTMDESSDQRQTPTAHARGYNFIFYLDEKPTSFWDLSIIKLSDIATIKILSPTTSETPPFKVQAGIIALYTKQGAFWGKDYYRYNYIVNGYQSNIYVLPNSPKMFATNPYYLR